MKNIIIAIVSLLTVLACNDEFLERYPLDKISDANYWKTSTDIELFANQFYTKLYDFRLAWYNLDNYGDNQVPTHQIPIHGITTPYLLLVEDGEKATGQI